MGNESCGLQKSDSGFHEAVAIAIAKKEARVGASREDVGGYVGLTTSVLIENPTPRPDVRTTMLPPSSLVVPKAPVSFSSQMSRADIAYGEYEELEVHHKEISDLAKLTPLSTYATTPKREGLKFPFPNSKYAAYSGDKNEHGKPQGKGSLFLSDLSKTRYSGLFQDGKFNGYGRLYFIKATETSFSEFKNSSILFDDYSCEKLGKAVEAFREEQRQVGLVADGEWVDNIFFKGRVFLVMKETGKVKSYTFSSFTINDTPSIL